MQSPINIGEPLDAVDADDDRCLAPGTPRGTPM